MRDHPIEITVPHCHSFCGFVEKAALDDGSATIKLLTSSHAITAEWPLDEAMPLVPNQGEPVFYNKDLDVVTIGRPGDQLVLAVERMGWGINGGKMALVGLYAISVLMTLVTYSFLGHAFIQALNAAEFDAPMVSVAVALGMVWMMIRWDHAVQKWTQRPLIGFAVRADLAA
jgi:hypothetical protein